MSVLNISQILIKRGTTAQIAVYTGPLGELVLNTDTHQLVAQDGITAGGHLVTGDFSGIQDNLSILQTEVANIAGITGNIAQLESYFANVNLEEITASISTIQTELSANGTATIGNLTTNLITFPYGNITSGTIGPGVTLTANVDQGQEFLGMFVGNTTNQEQGYIYVEQNSAGVQVTNTSTNQSYDWSFNSDGSMSLAGNLQFSDNSLQSTAYQGPAGQTSFATVANVTTANVALKAYVDNKIGLLANAPAILDTLGQIATAIQNDESNIGTLLTSMTATNANITAANVAWQANASAQQSLINTINANVGSFYTWANTNFGTSSYANANVTGYLAGNITIGNATATSFRSNNFLYANGVSILTGIGGTYSNSNVASYLLGNITTGNVGLSIGSWLDFRTTDQNWRIGYGLGAYTKTTAQTTIDVVVGQGQAGPDGFSVGQTGGTSIFELVGYTKNAWFANNVTVVGNVTSGNVLASGFFYANGTPFTSSSYGNTQVAAYLVANPQSGTYSNTNVSAYLTSATITTTGNITASNIVTTGALQGGSGTQGIALQPWTGGGSYAALYSTAITPANGNYSILVNGTSTWLNAGSGGSLFFRINNQTAPTAFTINASQATIGSIGTANSSAVNTQTLVVAGGGLGVTGSSYFSNTLGVGGNLILSNTSYVTSTTGSNGNITLDPDGTGQVSVVGSLTATGNITAGNLTTSGTYTVANITTTGAYGNITGANVISANTISATNFVYSANGVSILSGIGGTYSNSNVSAYLTTQTFYSNSNIASYLVNNPQAGTYSNSNVSAYLTTQTFYSNANVTSYLAANPQGSTYSNANIVANLQNYVTNISSTANIATTANMIAPNYLFANGVNILSTITPSSSYSNTNVAAYLTTQTFYSNSNVASYLVANPQAGTYSNSNVASYLTANPQGSTYSNANVVANLANYVTNIVSTANITAGNLIGTQYGNTVGTTGTFTGNVVANYFVGNGSALTGLTYNSVGNIYGSSSNVTLQAGSYSWTFDNTGNLVIPTTSNIVYANGTVFTSGTTGSSGTNYTNANVVSMLTANTAVFIGNVGVIGNVATGNIQANATAIFLGGNTVISNYGSPTFGYSTHIGNNIYFDANGVQRYRNTQTGAADLIVAPGTLNFYATGGAVTANAATGYTGATSLYMALSTSGMSLYNNAGLVSSGPITIQSATGLVTNQGTIGLFQNASTINAGTASGILSVGQSGSGTGSLGNVTIGAGTIQTGAVPLTVRASGTYNILILYGVAGGYNSPPYYNQSVTGGSGTGMTASYSSGGGYIGQSSLVVTNPGTGYKNGDIVTLPGGGGSTAQLYNYNPNISNGTTVGTANYVFGIDGNLALPGNVTLASNAVVAGDFSNSTFNYRTVFRTTTANATTGIYAVPSGTGTGAAWQAANSSNIANTSKIMITTNGSTDVQLVSGINGTGTYLPLSFLTNGSTQMQLDTAGNLTVVNGNATVAGNVTISGNAGVIQSNRTAFRVYGQGGSIGLNANLTASNWTVDYTQGFASTALNGTTGIFTAPMAGLYSTTLTARTTSNTNSSIIQAVINQVKAGITSVACMIEWAPNTTFNHATGSTVVKLAQGDQLWVQCLANGNGSGFSFDGNDHWDVTYLG